MMDEILKAALGRTGNLRAPAIKTKLAGDRVVYLDINEVFYG